MFLSLLLIVLDLFVFPVVPMVSYAGALALNILFLGTSSILAVLGFITLTTTEPDEEK